MERNENGYPTPRAGGMGQSGGCSRGSMGNGSMGRGGMGNGCTGNGGNGTDLGCGPMMGADLGERPLAYAYVPIQMWRMLYPWEGALSNGTLFEELYKPLGVYGNE